VPAISEKILKTMIGNGNINISQQQIDLHNLLKDNNYNVELNYPFKKYCLDIVLFINDIIIDIEYDGGGHYFFTGYNDDHDINRDNYLIENNIKILRIKARRLIPTLEQIIDSINVLLNTDKYFLELFLDDFQECINEIQEYKNKNSYL
jgi:very-short-patch-repair endonuclease